MQLTHYFCPWLLGWHQCNVIHAIMWIQRGVLPSGDHMLMLTCFSVCMLDVTCLSAAVLRSVFQRDISQVCREYQRGSCTRAENECRFAHPADSTMIDTNDNTVTVCMDYIKGRCSREKCKYFHPPAHLQAKIKATQHQVNQATAAAAMVSTPPPRSPALFRGSCAGVTFLHAVGRYVLTSDCVCTSCSASCSWFHLCFCWVRFRFSLKSAFMKKDQ